LRPAKGSVQNGNRGGGWRQADGGSRRTAAPRGGQGGGLSRRDVSRGGSECGGASASGHEY
jgi:hypothetical protein